MFQRKISVLRRGNELTICITILAIYQWWLRRMKFITKFHKISAKDNFCHITFFACSSFPRVKFFSNFERTCQRWFYKLLSTYIDIVAHLSDTSMISFNMYQTSYSAFPVHSLIHQLFPPMCVKEASESHWEWWWRSLTRQGGLDAFILSFFLPSLYMFKESVIDALINKVIEILIYGRDRSKRGQRSH